MHQTDVAEGVISGIPRQVATIGSAAAHQGTRPVEKADRPNVNFGTHCYTERSSDDDDDDNERDLETDV